MLLSCFPSRRLCAPHENCFPSKFSAFFRTKEKAPDRKKHFLSRASHLKSRHPWCHLAFAVIPHTYRNTIIFLATNVCLHVMEYSANAFPHALGGPFETPLSARLSPARTLCERACNVISASTVSVFMNLLCIIC